MGLSRRIELEVVETYLLDGRRRFRLRVKGTRIIVNVEAESEDEAVRKALGVLEKSRLVDVLEG